MVSETLRLLSSWELETDKSSLLSLSTKLSTLFISLSIKLSTLALSVSTKFLSLESIELKSSSEFELSPKTNEDSAMVLFDELNTREKSSESSISYAPAELIKIEEKMNKKRIKIKIIL